MDEADRQAIAEAWRNLTAVGATPLAVTNCLNFANPQRPEIMAQIVHALDGMGDGTVADEHHQGRETDHGEEELRHRLGHQVDEQAGPGERARHILGQSQCLAHFAHRAARAAGVKVSVPDAGSTVQTP